MLHRYLSFSGIFNVIFVIELFKLFSRFRQGEYIYCVAHSLRLEKKGKATEARALRKRATEEKRDATILGLIDGFLESALQLLLQIFIAADSQNYVTDFPIRKSNHQIRIYSWFSDVLIQDSRLCNIIDNKMHKTCSITLFYCMYIFSVLFDVLLVFNVTNHHNILQSQQESPEK